jgi:DNA polymerase
VRVYVDLETYSSVNLKLWGVHPYTESPDFRVLLTGWSHDGWTQVDEDIDSLAALYRSHPDATFIAHNAGFDRVALRAAGLDIPIEQWECSMIKATELGMPQSLDKLGKFLGGELKDPRGEVLVKFFCLPDRKGNRRLPEDYPEEWAEFIAYCRQDVVALADIDRKLGGFPTPMEKAAWHVDQKINDRGFRIDRELAQAAVEATEENNMLIELEMSHLSGIDNPNSNPQFLSWMRHQGLDVSDTTAGTIDRLLAGELTPEQRRVLELRQELALVAVKKFPAALATVSPDDRIRGAFRFFGAHTGRWSGKGLQPHNMPRAGFEDPEEEAAAILDLKMGNGARPNVLKKLVRPLLLGPFTVVDYSSIEARVIAWLGRELWALQAFRDGRDIYVETAKRMGGLSRSQGKVAVLALGFAGAVGSLKNMWDTSKMPLPSDEALLRLVRQWRSANPNIVALWGSMEEGFRTGGAVGDHLTVEKDGRNRFVRLPSGRALGYYDCRWDATDKGMAASFMDHRYGRSRTYGGSLTENAVQAVARDVLAEALVRLDALGYTVVAHTHDEVIIEGTHPVEEIANIMCQPLWWSDGLPIDAAGFTCERYRKG